jgi:deoxyribonuclease V
MRKDYIFIKLGKKVRIQYRHPWNVSLSKAKEIQLALSKNLTLEGNHSTFRFIAGTDVAYDHDTKGAWGGVVVFDIKHWEVVEECSVYSMVQFPYVPGFLAFREIPVLLKAFEKLEISPDVVLMDGQGIAHPRRMGMASHFGLLLELSTVGCAKNCLLGEYEPVGVMRGSASRLRAGKETVGYILRTRERVKPVFVSPGHRIDFEKSIEVVLTSCHQYRIPEPLRLAHMLASKMKKRACTHVS